MPFFAPFLDGQMQPNSPPPDLASVKRRRKVSHRIFTPPRYPALVFFFELFFFNVEGPNESGICCTTLVLICMLKDMYGAA